MCQSSLSSFKFFCQLIPTTVSLSNCDSPLINYKTFVQHLKTNFDKQIIFNRLNNNIVVREPDEHKKQAKPSKLGTIMCEPVFRILGAKI